MRMSDWSSDVCSSDLPRVEARLVDAGNRADTGKAVVDIAARDPEQRAIFGTIALEQRIVGARIERREGVALTAGGLPCPQDRHGEGERPAAQIRSEEHTSEFQSLMRISYAVFCLKTKTRSINA